MRRSCLDFRICTVLCELADEVVARAVRDITGIVIRELTVFDRNNFSRNSRSNDRARRRICNSSRAECLLRVLSFLNEIIFLKRTIIRERSDEQAAKDIVCVEIFRDFIDRRCVIDIRTNDDVVENATEIRCRDRENVRSIFGRELRGGQQQ